MKIGFDYWQVVSHYPNQVAHMIDAFEAYNSYLSDSPEHIHIISAVGKDRAGTVAANVDKILHPRLSRRYYKVHEVVFDHPKQSPELKLAKCKELGIDIFFDDRDDVCRLLNKHGIMAMRVTRKDNSTYDLGAEQK